MENNLLNLSNAHIEVSPGLVTFNGFLPLKEQAEQLAAEIKNVEVNDENIKVSKKMLAAVNKRVKEISDKRISIKKELLESYSEFEGQVKEITGIVKDADDFLRGQVKQLEEQDRAEKEAAIRSIFDKRIGQYTLVDVFTFDDFITSQHLNKSKSMKSVETEMVDWLEKKDADIKVIQGLPNNYDVLMEYKDTKDLAVAMNNVKQHEDYKRELEKVVPRKEQKSRQEYVITVNDPKDLKMVEMFMQQNDIDYSLMQHTI